MPIEKKQYTKDLKEGDRVSDHFLVASKTEYTDKNNNKYCRVRFKDSEGTIQGMIWAGCLKNCGVFDEGDIVSIQGKVIVFNKERQLEVDSLEIVDKDKVNPEEYSRVILDGKDISGLLADLMDVIEEIEKPDLKRLLINIFSDGAYRDRFARSTAAIKYHHAYPGGLLEHTLSVVNICKLLADHYGPIDRDLLIAGAILHDVGKTEEYKTNLLGSEITESGRLLGHINIGYGMVLEKISGIKGFDEGLKDRLLHIILSHHGLQEYGSPKRPKSREAFLVFHADYMDADMGGYDIVIRESAEGSTWSGYQKKFGRPVLIDEYTGQEKRSISKKKGSKSAHRIPEEIKDSIKKALGDEDKDDQGKLC